MINQTDDFLQSAIKEATGLQVKTNKVRSLSGGCINNAAKVATDQGAFLVKYNDNCPDNLFEAEAKGLSLLRENTNITIPKVYGQGIIEGTYFIVMEFIDSLPPKRHYWAKLGEQLAEMHKNARAGEFGLHFQNHIGRLGQYNDPNPDWIDFFIEKRLQVQLDMAKGNGYDDPDLHNRFDQLFQRLPDLLVTEAPSLIHGDLWSGNVMTDGNGEGCIIDPAVYYAHREIEMAFTTMFGGFGQDFYKNYQKAYPMEPGYEDRFDIYNLYPLLVHVNLFGGVYLSGVERTLRRFT